MNGRKCCARIATIMIQTDGHNEQQIEKRTRNNKTEERIDRTHQQQNLKNVMMKAGMKEDCCFARHTKRKSYIYQNEFEIECST